MIKDRNNEEDFAENDKRGIDNPELNRDQNNLHDKDRDFDTEAEEEDENDDFHTNGIDDEHSLTDAEDYDEDPQQRKQNQQHTGTEKNPDNDRP